MSTGAVVVREPDPHELKDAMTQLSKAVLKVFRLSSPHLTYSGAIKELPEHAEKVSGLQLGAAGDTLLLRSGHIEIQLYPVLSEDDEALVLDALMAKAALRRHQQAGIPSQPFDGEVGVNPKCSPGQAGRAGGR